MSSTAYLSVAVVGAIACYIVARVVGGRKRSDRQPEPPPENEWQVSVSALEFNYALNRLCDEIADIERGAGPRWERPADVPAAIDLATKLVAARLLTVKDAEVIERHRHALAVVNGRLVAKAEEERRNAYLQAHRAA